MLVVADWGRMFENNRSRIVKRLDWIRMPNRHDGSTYAEIIEGPHGEAVYGCWSLVVQVASKCHPRGTLVRSDGQAHDAQSLARAVRARPTIMTIAIKRLLKVGWLLEVNPRGTLVSTRCQDDVNTVSPKCRDDVDRGEERRGEESTALDRKGATVRESRTVQSSPSAAAKESEDLRHGNGKDNHVLPEEIYLAYPRKIARGKALAEIKKALKHKDLHAAAADLGVEPDYLLFNLTERFAFHVKDNPERYFPFERGRQQNYVPHPSTWFEELRFLDDPAEERPQ